MPKTPRRLTETQAEEPTTTEAILSTKKYLETFCEIRPDEAEIEPKLRGLREGSRMNQPMNGRRTAASVNEAPLASSQRWSAKTPPTMARTCRSFGPTPAAALEFEPSLSPRIQAKRRPEERMIEKVRSLWL